jgi:hypothetical protein
LAAESRAKELAKQAHFNEAVRVITELEQEVAAMHISNRFSTTKTPNFDMMVGIPNPNMKNLTEAEFKRRTLLNDLQALKSKIALIAANVEDIVMDIEATKIDDPR